jgi:hypothetical protein
MNRVTIKLKDLKPNPYKKDVCGGRIEEYVVAQIKESASKTSFWEQWVVREKDGEYQMAFGHHRLAAALELYGPEYTVSVQVEPYTDEQMLVALADENAGKEESVEVQVDVIRVARTFLKEHPEACKWKHVPLDCLKAHPEKARKDDQHKHGSIPCLLSFLGDINWNQQKIHSLVSIADGFDANLLRDVANEEHPERRATLGITAAMALAELEKPVQRAAVVAIRDASKELDKFKEKEVASRKKLGLPHSGVSKMVTHIPASVVKYAVSKAAGAPKEKQEQIVVYHIKDTVAKRKQLAIDSSIPHAENVISHMVSQLYNFPEDKAMQELLGNREYLSNIGKENLLRSLVKHNERIAGYIETLLSTPQQKLTA